jgi:hypothetical protein
MILGAISLLIGLMSIAVNYLFKQTIITYFPSAILAILGLILIIQSTRYNTYAICINDFNGKKVYRIYKARKYYKAKGERAGYYVKIEGFPREFKYPEKQYVNINQTHKIPNLLFFFQENDQLSPINAEYDLNVKFISTTLLANRYQMINKLEKVVRPPQDTLQTITNILLIVVMLGAIITNVYMASKSGINVGPLESMIGKMDQVLDGMAELMFKLQGGVVNVVGMTNQSIGSVPPITGLPI